MSHVMVTGATGYLGSVLVPLLARSPGINRITLVVRDPAKLRLFAPLLTEDSRIGWVTLDSLTTGKVNMPRPDVICHMAKGRNTSNNREMAEALELMSAMIRFAQNASAQRFIFTSSQAVYGQTPPPWREDTPAAPATLYGLMSYSCELMLRTAALTTPGLKTLSLRLGKLIGPAPIFRSNQGETPHLMAASALMEQRLTIDRGGKQQLDFLDVRDAAAIMVRLITDSRSSLPAVMNLGGGRPITLAELARLTSSVTARLYGKPLNYVVTDAGSHTRHFGMSIERLRAELGELELTPLATTIEDICRWLRLNATSQSHTEQ